MMSSSSSVLLLLLAAVLLVAGFAVVLKSRRRQGNNHRRPRRPPSPPKLPILGNLHQVGKYPHRTFARLAKLYGDPMLFHFGRKPVLVVTSSVAAREVLKTNDLIASDRPQIETANRLLYGVNKDITNAAYGDYWRQLRRLCVLHLLSTRKVQSGRSVREEEIGLLINRIKQNVQIVRAVNLSELLFLLSNDVICRMALGRKYDVGASTNFKDLLAEFTGLLGTFTVGDFIPCLWWVNRFTGFDSRVDRVAQQFDELLNAAILESEARNLEKRSNTNSSCSSVITEDNYDDQTFTLPFIDTLLQLQKDAQLDTDAIKALILDMFVAATDTSATLLEWTMSELMKHPRVMKKLREELRRELVSDEKGEIIIGEADLEKLKYLKLVIKETIRLHPPLPLLLPRQFIEDTTILGYDVSAGTMILMDAWEIGRDPADWTESPGEFWPERFLNSDVDFRGQDFKLLPFGAGRRGCPGISFGLAVVEHTLAHLVGKFDWELPGGVEGQELDMTEATGFIAYRKTPLVAIPAINVSQKF
ncbi:unnamed protein product [Linum tenue]|uniref:Cytochrome P450 n=1 Tax=Linum tenue TaxID=586396 RepID=A0AAV0JI85_9ROSI|nr:unnamed protein product [Linum tenue]